MREGQWIIGTVLKGFERGFSFAATRRGKVFIHEGERCDWLDGGGFGVLDFDVSEVRLNDVVALRYERDPKGLRAEEWARVGSLEDAEHNVEFDQYYDEKLFGFCVVDGRKVFFHEDDRLIFEGGSLYPKGWEGRALQLPAPTAKSGIILRSHSGPKGQRATWWATTI